MSNPGMKKLDAAKLYDNAVVSIQLGIEDFKLSQLDEHDGGNPLRALSSVRNFVFWLATNFLNIKSQNPSTLKNKHMN